MPGLLEALCSAKPEELGECLKALLALLPQERWAEKLGPVIESWAIGRKALLAEALWRLASESDPREEIDQLQDGIMGADAKAAIAVCRKVGDGRDATRSAAAKLLEPERMILRDLARAEPGKLSARAIVVLAELGEPIAKLLPPLSRCADEYVRRLAVFAASIEKSPDARRVLRDALTDPDYRCRRVAMIELAPDANDDERRLILAMVHDRSAPIQEACAELIGKYRWEDGLEVLCQLLEDRRDASEEFASNERCPNYHVARAAARALAQFDRLPLGVLDQVISCVGRRDRGDCDLVVRVHLIDVIGKSDDARVLPLLQELIADTRFMPGHRNEGFPLRFAAAWEIVWRLLGNPDLGSQIRSDVLAGGACHEDGRLAGPCLLALGLLGPPGCASLPEALAGSTGAPERGLLLRAAMQLSGAAPDEADRAGLVIGPEQGHPGLSVLQLARTSPPSDEPTWSRWLGENPAAADWLATIQPAQDVDPARNVNPALRLALNLLFAGKLERLLGCDDIRAADVAEPVPIITMRSMCGGE